MRACTKLALAVLFASPAFALGQITGFSGFAPTNYQLNGVTTADPAIGYQAGGSTFSLTTGLNGQTTSGYYPTPVNLTSFTAHFDYTSVGNPYGTTAGQFVAADGLGFNFINTGYTASRLGASGGGRGIGGTTDSASVMFDNFGGFINFNGRTGVSTGGVDPEWFALAPASLFNRTIGVDLVYSAGVLTQTVTDNSTGTPAVFSHQYTVNIPNAVGNTTGLLGFSSATGGYAATGSVTNFSFTSGTGVPVSGIITKPVYAPIAISGQNKVVVVPKEANPNEALLYLSATMDAGTGFTLANTRYTYFEKGFATAPANTGIPVSGSTFISKADPRHTFKMPTFNTTPDFNGTQQGFTNDSFCIDRTIPTITMSIATPKAYSDLSFLAASGNGPVPLGVVLHYTDGSSFDAGTISILDWFGSANVAYSGDARFQASDATFQTATGNVNLNQIDLDIPDVAKLVSSITLTYAGAADGAGFAAIFALSGKEFANTVIPGDYNRDGFVDAADYTVWADHFGQTGTGVAGDGNNDGVVNAADYTVWADHFGQGTPHVAAVPEPTALALLAPVAGLLARRRRA